MTISIFARLTIGIAATLSGCFQTGLLATQVGSPRIAWRVEAPFAPFGALDDPQAVAQTWLPRANQAGVFEKFEDWYKRISVSQQSPFAALLDSPRNPWDEDRGRYRADYSRPTKVVIVATAAGAGPDCKWRVTDAQGTVTQTDSRCDTPVRIEAPLKGGTLSVTSDVALPALKLDIQHKVVVAIGDSYGSGEGNPDVPTRWKPEVAPRGSYNWLRDPDKKGSLIAAGARWWDTRCHRSFWSHQTYVAMRLAAEHPRQLVTYLHYSCSAAEVFDGLLVRQFKPPGTASNCSSLPHPDPTIENIRHSGCYVARSQLAAAVRDLCRGQLVTTGPAISDIRTKVEHFANAPKRKLYFMDTYRDADLDVVSCSDAEPRRPDLVLLSIGGNDVGFGALAGWAVMPAEARNPIGKFTGLYRFGRGFKVTCPATGRQKRDGCREPYDSTLIGQLARRFEPAADALVQLLRADPATVVVTHYPDPLRNRGGTLCGELLGFDPNGPLAGAYSKVPKVPFLPISKRWDFNLTVREARVLSVTTLPALRGAIETAAKAHRFKMASATADVFVGHCWQARDEDDDTTALPSARPADWTCPSLPSGSPACWKPFATRRRFIRTINDALLTQSSERNDDMTGAVHPTAQGHAAVADALLVTVYAISGFGLTK